MGFHMYLQLSSFLQTNIAIEHGPVEIVDLPIKDLVFFHFAMSVDQAGYFPKMDIPTLDDISIFPKDDIPTLDDISIYFHQPPKFPSISP